MTVAQGLMIGYHSLGKIIDLADNPESVVGDNVLAGFASAAQVLIAEVIDALNNNTNTESEEDN